MTTNWKRFLMTGIASLGVGLIATSCAQKADTSSAPPPLPPRDSPQSPVRAVNPRIAGMANIKQGGTVATKKRDR